MIVSYLPLYIHRKDCAGINMVALCDHRFVFIWVDYSSPGSHHDSKIFSEGGGYDFIKRMRSKVSDDQLYILGDAGFPISDMLITPFRPSSVDTNAMVQFNKPFSNRRVTTERAFGILKRRFQILDTRLEYDFKGCQFMIHAVLSLHNLLVIRGYTSPIDVKLL